MGVRITNSDTGEYASKVSTGVWEMHDGRTLMYGAALRTLADGSPFVAKFEATKSDGSPFKCMGFKIVEANGVGGQQLHPDPEPLYKALALRKKVAEVHREAHEASEHGSEALQEVEEAKKHLELQLQKVGEAESAKKTDHETWLDRNSETFGEWA